MAVVLPVKGSLNWDISLNAALTYLDNNTTALTGTFVDLTSNQNVGGTKSFTSPTNMSSLTLTGAGAGSTELAAQVVGDTNSRYNVTAAGVQNWGSGSAAADTNLYRGAANQLNTDDALVVGLTLTSTGDITANGRVIENSASDRTAFSAAYTATNTNNAAYNYLANAATGRFLGISVTGDTVGRYAMLADGSMTWGPGGSTARDTNLYRAAASLLQTDQTFVSGQSIRATSNLVVGASTVLGDNGVGELQLTNATTAPTTNPTGGVAVYSQAGVVKTRNPQGSVAVQSGVVAVQTTTTTVTTTGLQTLQTYTVPANDPAVGAVYEMTGYGVYTSNATATTNLFNVYWGGTGGTVLAAIPAFTITPSLTNASFTYKAIVTFRTATTCVASIQLHFGNSTSADTVVSYVASGSTVATVTTSTAQALAIAVNFNNAQSISLLGGDVRRMA